jgi:predicted Fe-Mo cluster-binding NifX family protein
LGKIRIAIPTNENKGMEDFISEVFGRAKTFTIIDIDNNKVTDVKILENSAASYHHGAGPIAVKMLIDKNVNMVLGKELGVGAAEMLKEHKIVHKSVKPNKKVEETLREVVQIEKKNRHTLKIHARLF